MTPAPAHRPFHRQPALDTKRRSRVVENDEYAAFLRRVIRAYSRRVAAGDIEAISTMAALADDLDQAIRQAITGLRADGYSWADIALRLGITRQGAQQRWGGDRPVTAPRPRAHRSDRPGPHPAGHRGHGRAASFTHVHDWTMRNAPPGTGSWFGWANAVISELTPTAAGIEIRRRKRQHRTGRLPDGRAHRRRRTLPGRPGRPGPAQHHRLAARRRPRPVLPGPDQTHLLPHPRPLQATTPARRHTEHRDGSWHYRWRPGHSHPHRHGPGI